MTISVVQDVTAGGDSDATFTNPINPGNSIIIIGQGYGGGTASEVWPTPPTQNGSTPDGTSQLCFTEDAAATSLGFLASFWLMPAVTDTSGVIHLDNASGNNGFVALEVQGLGSAPALDANGGLAQAFSSSGGSQTAMPSGDIPALASSDALLIGTAAIYGGSNYAGPDGWSSPGSQAYYSLTQYQIVTSAEGNVYQYDPSDAADSDQNWGSMIAAVVPGSAGTSASGSVKLKKMVLSGASAEKSSASGVITLKKMVLSGAVLDGITFTTIFNGPGDGAFSEDSATGDTLLIFVALYSVDGPSSSNPKCEGTSIDGTVQLWEVQNPDGDGGAMYSSAWMLPNLPFPGSGFSIDTSGGSYPSPDGAFVVVKVTGLGPSPTVDRVITNESIAGDDGSIGPTSAIRSVKELVVAHCAIYGGWPDTGPGDPWTSDSAAAGVGRHGIVSYQVTDSSGGTYTWAESGNGNAWAGGIATIAATSDSNSASVAVSLKKMVLSGASAEKAVVTGAVKLKKMVLSGASAEKAVVTAAVKLKKMVLSGASAEKAVVTAAVKLKKMVVAASSAEKAVATGAVKLKKMVLSGASAEKAVATGAVKLKKMVLSGASAEKAVVTGAVKLKKMVLSGSSTKTVSASGAINLKKMVISGASHEKAVITGSVKLKKLVVTASGTEKPAITGTISLKKIVLSGASHEKAVITGSIHLNKMRLHGEEARRKASNLFVFAPP